jgi:hypothetical protein
MKHGANTYYAFLILKLFKNILFISSLIFFEKNIYFIFKIYTFKKGVHSLPNFILLFQPLIRII